MPTILVADDNSNIQKMVTLALKEAGINVVAVGNGEAAARKMPDVRPDLVLADIFMPVKNGYELCEFVKGDERFAHIPVVLLVGAFDPLDEHEVERVHADGVLKKPFVPPDPLVAMVTSLLTKGPAASPAVAAAIASSEAPPAQRVERTQQLTAEEIAAATHQAGAIASPPAPEPEPEPEQFGTQQPALAIDEAHSPVAFSDMLGTEEEAQAETEEEAEEEEGGEEEGEEEEAEAKPAFEASSLSGVHIPGEFEPGHAAPSAPEAAHEAVEEVDHWAGIKEEQKKPDEYQPPIRVEFHETEPVELVTDETREAVSKIEVRQDPALVTNPDEWMSAVPPAAHAAPPEVVHEPEPAHEPEPERPSFAMESVAPLIAGHEPLPGVEETQGFTEPPAPEPPAQHLESLAEELHAEAVAAAPVQELEETQHFTTPPTPAAPPAFAAAPAAERETHEHEPAAPSTWGRVEEVMLPAVPVVAEAAAAIHAHFAGAEPAAPAEIPAAAASAPAPAATSQTGTGPDLLIAAITQKVMEQLDPKMIERLSRELVRPLIEALVRREVDKD